MPRPPRKLRIFLASPDDVAPERRSVAAQIDCLVKEFDPNLATEIFDWKNIPPGFSPKGAQAVIDGFVDREPYDLMIGLFRAYFGKPAPPNGWTPTEHEIRRALAQLEANGRPSVWVYFSEKLPAGERTLDDVKQLNRVVAFREELRKDRGGLCPSFKDSEDLAQLVDAHFRSWLAEKDKKTRAPQGLRVGASADAPHVRCVGITEPLGDIQLRVDGGMPQPPDGATWTVSVHVSLNVKVTADDSTGRFSGPELRTASGFRIRGILGATNRVSFDGVPFDVDGGRPWCRISGLRANASQIGHPGRYERDITSFISVTAPYAVPVENNIVPLGESVESVDIKFSARMGHPKGLSLRTPTGSYVTCRVEFTETYLGAFSDQFSEQSETHGTRFLVRVFNLPADANVYLGRFDRADLDNPQAALVEECDADGAGGARVDSNEVPARPWLRTSPAGGFAWAVWEFSSAELNETSVPLHPRRLAFDLVISYSGSEVAQLRDVKLVASLAPLSTVTTSSERAPIPRFLDSGVEFDLEDMQVRRA